MSAPLMNASTATTLDAWLSEQTEKGLLRFMTCGSVDDGKSTLIGRLVTSRDRKAGGGDFRCPAQVRRSFFAPRAWKT